MKKPVYPVREEDHLLHIACRELNIGKIRMAIANGADVNAPDEKHEYAPLDIVAHSLRGWDDYRFNPDYQRQIRMIVDILLSNGADPNGINADIRPLEIFAWSCCDPVICSQLVQCGVRKNFCCEESTVLDLVINEITYLASTEGSREVIDRLDKIYDILVKHGAKGFHELNEEHTKNS